VLCQMMTTGGNVDHIAVGECHKGGCKKARLPLPSALSSTDSQLQPPSNFCCRPMPHISHSMVHPVVLPPRHPRPPFFCSRNDEAFPTSGRADLARGRPEPTQMGFSTYD